MLAELWIEFGRGKSYRDIPLHIPHRQLGLAKSLALPLFHSLTSCDTAHFPHFELWQEECRMYGRILLTETWIVLTNDSECLTLESVHGRIERFVQHSSVNDARYNLFFTGSHSSENIPPTQAAIFEHVRRSVLQDAFNRQQTDTT